MNYVVDLNSTVSILQFSTVQYYEKQYSTVQGKSTIYETGENYSNEICVNRIKQPPWNLSVT